MTNFLSGSAFTLSLLALALSGLAAFKVTTLDVAGPTQTDCPLPSLPSPDPLEEPLW